MKVKAKVKNTVDTKKVKKKTKEAEITSLTDAIKDIRKKTLQSIKKGEYRKDAKTITEYRQASKAGERPRHWKNKSRRQFKKGIRYHLSTDSRGNPRAALYAAPQNPDDKVYQLLEQGGYGRFEYTYNQVVDDRRYRRHTYEKIKKGEWTVKKMSERSAKEQQAIKNYYKNIARVKKITVKKTGHYQARPYLMPTVKSYLPKLIEKLQKGIIKSYK